MKNHCPQTAHQPKTHSLTDPPTHRPTDRPNQYDAAQACLCDSTQPANLFQPKQQLHKNNALACRMLAAVAVTHTNQKQKIQQSTIMAFACLDVVDVRSIDLRASCLQSKHSTN